MKIYFISLSTDLEIEAPGSSTSVTHIYLDARSATLRQFKGQDCKMVLWRSRDNERDGCAGMVLNWNSLKCPLPLPGIWQVHGYFNNFLRKLAIFNLLISIHTPSLYLNKIQRCAALWEVEVLIATLTRALVLLELTRKQINLCTILPC